MKTPTLTTEPKATVLGDAPLHAQAHPERRYTVTRSKKDRSETVVAEHLPWEQARALADRLDAEYRAAVAKSGRFYSSWTADLHFCCLEKGGAQ